MHKLVKIFVRLTLISFIITSGYLNFLQVEVFAKEKINENSYMFVVKDDIKYNEILNTLKVEFPTVDIHNMKEINTFSISSDDEVLLNNAEQYINKQYNKLIEEKGNDYKITLDPISTVNNNVSLINRFVELNNPYQMLFKLDNEYETWRWDIDKVTNNRESYDIQQGNHKVKVAIIDSGIDANHPDLKDNIISSKSCVPGSDSLKDTLGHGTIVAGEIAANGNVKGVAPKIAIASYKVFNDDDCDSSWVIQAIIQAANDNMDVINLSLGTYKSLLNKDEQATSVAYERAISYAQSRNCVVVAASGNEAKGLDISDPIKLAQERGCENDSQMYLPGGLPNVITVSATNKDDKIAYYSNYGSNIKISAPGADYGPDWEKKKIPDLRYMALVTYPTNLPQSELSSMMGFKPGYEFIEGGTSIAAPKVSATAALLISQYEEKYGSKPSSSKVEKLLYEGATPGADDNNTLYYGKGILNVENSLKLIEK